MKQRLKTSKQTSEYLDEMQSTLRMPTKASLARIAIGLSLRETEDPTKDPEIELNDVTGFEFQRSTLTGEHDEIYKAMISQKHKVPLTDEQYLTKYLKAHLERGVAKLYSEYLYAGNREKLFKHLLELE